MEQTGQFYWLISWTQLLDRFAFRIWLNVFVTLKLSCVFLSFFIVFNSFFPLNIT